MHYSIKFILGLGVFIFFIGCGVDETWKDKNIAPEIRTSIDSLNDLVISALIENDPEAIRLIASQELIAKSNNDLSFFVNVVNKNIDSATFKILNQFHLKSLSIDITSSLFSSLVDEHDYKITFTPLNKNTVVTIGEFRQTKQSFLLLTSFGKFRNGWKLNILHFGLIKIADKDAIDWFQNSKADFEAGDTIGAIDKLNLVNDLLKPGGEYWTYQKEDEIIKWRKKLEAVINSRSL